MSLAKRLPVSRLTLRFRKLFMVHAAAVAQHTSTDTTPLVTTTKAISIEIFSSRREAGLAIGDALGASEGSAVGVRVGAGVGEREGGGVGMLLGKKVGRAVGE